MRVENIERRRTQTTANALQHRSRSVTPTTIPPDYEDAAVAFFLRNFTITAPDYGSRGYTDIVRERYSKWPSESPTALATKTIASELFSIWRPSLAAENKTRSVLGRALGAIKEALTTHTTALHDDTLLAVLLLQFYTNVSRYKRLSKGSGDHQEGARALVYHRGQLNFKSRESQRLFQTVRNHLISSAVRTGTHLELDPTMWNSGQENYRPKPAQLDWLGLEVANLKADYLVARELEARADTMPSCYNTITLSTLVSRAVTADQHLRSWKDSLTSDWYPVSVTASGLAPESFASPGQASCESATSDAYCSIQAADTWNQYRVYRLICLHIIWYCRAMQDRDAMTSSSSFVQEFWCDTPTNFDIIAYQIQEMVDQICGSVPFHLGGRTERETVDEYDKSDVLTCSLAASSSHSSRSSSPHSTGDTIRALISSGSWYILGPLSFLVQSFSPQSDQGFEPPPVRERQIDWVKGQLLRIMEMHGATGDLGKLGNDRVRELRRSLWYTPGV